MATTFDHRSGKHIEVEDGARIYAEVHGRESDPALVLLHGGMGTMNDFDAITSRFESKFRLVGIDSRGHGASTRGTAPLTYARIEADVQAVLRALAVERFSVLGFSDGGMVALRLAASWKAAIDKVIVIGTPWQLTPEDPLRAVYAKVTGASWRAKFPGPYERYQQLNPEPDFDAFTAAMVKMWLDDSDTGYPVHLLPSIDREVLVVHGDDDHLVTRASSFGLVERLSRAKLLVLPFAGHVVQNDQPDLLMGVMNQLLRAR